MPHYRPVIFLCASLFICMLNVTPVQAQITSVGEGGYTTTFPGVDAANRNTYPSGTPQLSGNALGKPVPTNDWWSLLLKSNHAGNLFNYPMALKTMNPGLMLSYIPWGVLDDQNPIVVGVTGLNADRATVADHSDWTVTMDWDDGTHHLQATTGVAMPFIYFEKESSDIAQITVNLGDVTVSGEMLIIANARNDADFVIYAPTGSSWTQSGNTYTSNLNNQNYWSAAMLPLSVSDLTAVAEAYQKYAYVFPVNTTADWSYDPSTSVVRTDFVVETEVKEGTDTTMLIGLLPHQWANLANDSPVPGEQSYFSVRGEIRTLAGNVFSINNTFKGILPALPYLANYSDGFSPFEMNRKISLIENDQLATWTDSYNEGQVMNRLIQTARIADQTGNIEARDKMLATIKERLEDWLTAEPSEIAFLFYYNSDWTTMIGYPAGHGQDGNINDHHFHWGYFIHAAAFLEQFEPGWADQWGEMINHLVRDAASQNRDDAMYPYLRNFNPYSGHCWANGFATFPQGNDQESTSESMQFNSSLIHWGTVTGNDAIRDLGIYLYTTEQTAIEEYWFDIYERNFAASQQYSLVSRVWGNSYDNGTFWTSDIAASYGIEMYPIHGGSLYLGHHPDYSTKLWNEITENTGILNNEVNDNLWHDVMWAYRSFTDPEAAIALYNSYPDRSLKFGISDAHTYHWLHAMNALGTVRPDITADYPIAVAFEKNGEVTYTGHNYSSDPLEIHFSDGHVLHVPAGQMATSRDIGTTGILTSDFNQAYVNGSVRLTVTISGDPATRVEFWDGNTLLGTDADAPYEMTATDLSLGVHGMYAKVFVDENFNVTNLHSVVVGEQLPYFNAPAAIPGTIEAGHYDKFEGGTGQDIAYVDLDQENRGGFRPGEYVDAVSDPTEGDNIGWISAGEWLEYTIEVQNAGIYDLSFRYASGNENGGGPFHFEIDGAQTGPDIFLDYTGDWDDWTDKTVDGIELNKGKHVLRLVFEGGEFNLGRLNFTYAEELGYAPPVANAGDNVVVLLPETTARLDGSASYDPDDQPLTYSWEQVYGPSQVLFSDQEAVDPGLSNLVEGIYKCKLTVSDGTYTSISYVLVIVSATTDIPPSVTIISPADGSSFYGGSDIVITAAASDLDGEIVLVEFFNGAEKIGEASTDPFEVTWSGETAGTHFFHALATDDSGATATSDSIQIEILPPPSCAGGPENGDYTYLFSEDKDNPTLTFIPGANGVGSPTCILYYGATEPFPGYNVTPGVPFRINAEEGSVVHFYYTYSYQGMEKNTAADKHTYTIGTCAGGQPDVILEIEDQLFAIDENIPEGTRLATPAYTYTGFLPLTFSLISGNEAGAFNINSSTGEMTVADPAPIDYETSPEIYLEYGISDGLLNSSAIITLMLNDLDETLVEDGLAASPRVYPNPVTERLFIDWTDFAEAAVRELTGRKLFISTKSELDLGMLPQGIYILELTGKDDQHIRLKIVKE